MKTIFVVDGGLDINTAQVSEEAWEEGVFITNIGKQSIIVQRGGWTKITEYAGFETEKEALKFKKTKEVEAVEA